MSNYCRDIPAELTVLFEKLHTILGGDNKASKQWQSICTKLVCPAPYRNELHAKNMQSVLEISKCIEFDTKNWKNLGNKQDKLVQFWLEKGPETAHWLLKCLDYRSKCTDDDFGNCFYYT